MPLNAVKKLVIHWLLLWPEYRDYAWTTIYMACVCSVFWSLYRVYILRVGTIPIFWKHESALFTFDIISLGNADDQIDISVIVVVGSSLHLTDVVSHFDVLCVGLQVFGGHHDNKLDCSFLQKGFVWPAPDWPDAFHGWKIKNRLGRSGA